MQLAREAVRLIREEGLSPESILMLAGSARNRQRLRDFLEAEGERAGLPYPPVPVLMLDEYFGQLLRLFADRISLTDGDGRPAGRLSHDFRVLGDLEATVLLRQVLQAEIPPDHRWYYPARSLAFARALFQVFRSDEGLTDTPDLKRFHDAFITRTRLKSLLTMPDLARLAGTLVAESPGCTAHVRAVLLDEAQELADVHYRFLDTLAPDAPVVRGPAWVRTSRPAWTWSAGGTGGARG